MSRIAAVTATAAAVLAAAGFASGRMLGEHAGAGGALEWLLRTLVVISAAVFVAGGAVLVLRVRRRVRPRPLGWAVAVLAAAAFAWVVAIPVAYGVYLTHLPGRQAVHDVDLGAPKLDVTLTGAGGTPIRGWYVPSRNGAAVIALHGTGGSRLGVTRHARMLVRHGYGVLALDLRGHGASGGRSTSLPWLLDDDMNAAVAWLNARPDVHDGRIGALGVSLGGEVALEAAGRMEALRAVVAEGLSAAGPADLRTAGADPATIAQVGAMFGLSRVLAGSGPSASDRELVVRAADRPLLLVSAGRGLEAEANRAYARAAGANVRLWNLPGAAHGSALRTDPAGYERRVTAFLDRALLGRD